MAWRERIAWLAIASAVRISIELSYRLGWQ
jgi:hypothetical protein